MNHITSYVSGDILYILDRKEKRISVTIDADSNAFDAVEAFYFFLLDVGYHKDSVIGALEDVVEAWKDVNPLEET